MCMCPDVCPRCGSDEHNLFSCPLPWLTIQLGILGSVIAAMLMSMAGVKL